MEFDTHSLTHITHTVCIVFCVRGFRIIHSDFFSRFLSSLFCRLVSRFLFLCVPNGVKITVRKEKNNSRSIIDAVCSLRQK